MKKTLNTLQSYRGFAAILVVMSHAQHIHNEYFSKNNPSHSLEFGNAGVQFFFVLSGFIIFWSHSQDLGKPGQTGKYLFKRFIRIYPIYWVVTLVLLPFWLLVPSFGLPYHKEFIPLVKSLLLLPQQHAPHLSVAWTLTHEVLFYLVFATMLVSRRFGVLLIGAWGAGILFTQFQGTQEAFPWNFLWNINNLLFILGIAGAIAVSKVSSLAGKPGLCFFLAGNLLFAFAALGNGTLPFVSEPVLAYGLSSLLIVLGARSGLMENIFKKRRLLLFLGNASYSIYLINYPVVSLAGKIISHSRVLSSFPGLLMIPCLMAIEISAGAALYAFVERPLLSRLRPIQLRTSGL